MTKPYEGYFEAIRRALDNDKIIETYRLVGELHKWLDDNIILTVKEVKKGKKK